MAELDVMIRIDQLVAELEAEEYPTNEILDALHNYLELADEFGYLRLVRPSRSLSQLYLLRRLRHLR